MAHKKAGGSSRNGRDSAGKRLGIKAYGGEHVIPGNIIARQRGTTWHPGLNVGMGTDHTLFAKIEGRVEFRNKANGRTVVSVLPMTKAAKGEAGNRPPLFYCRLLVFEVHHRSRTMLQEFSNPVLREASPCVIETE